MKKTFMNPTLTLCVCVCVCQLLDTKSTDRTQTLLHYIANVVREKYPAVSLFYNELHYVDKAAAGESVHQPECTSTSDSLALTCVSSPVSSEFGERPL